MRGIKFSTLTVDFLPKDNSSRSFLEAALPSAEVLVQKYQISLLGVSCI